MTTFQTKFEISLSTVVTLATTKRGNSIEICEKGILVGSGWKKSIYMYVIITLWKGASHFYTTYRERKQENKRGIKGIHSFYHQHHAALLIYAELNHLLGFQCNPSHVIGYCLCFSVRCILYG